MIDAKELRIGNWVSYEVEGETKISQVIPSDFIALGFDFNIFNPIPLTPELLEKAGFTSRFLGNYHIASLKNSHGCIRVEKDSMQVTIEIGDLGGNTETSIPHIKYLHQLQNLIFALTGQELEITL